MSALVGGHASWANAGPLVASEHRRAAKRWRKGLSMEQIYALRRYSGSSFSQLNAHLRGASDPRYHDTTGELHARTLLLDEVLREIEPLTLATPLVAWRGTALPDLLRQRGRWVDPAWVSCSLDSEHARFAAQSSPENQRGALLEIELAAGCQYLPLSLALAGSDIACEHEILLLPGHRFTVTGAGTDYDDMDAHLAMRLAARGPWTF